MRYIDGSEILLGDLVSVPVPEGSAKARVVMLGETYEHLDIEEQFLNWVKTDKIIQRSSVIIEWIESNPFSSESPEFAPVGNYMFSPVDEWLTKNA